MVKCDFIRVVRRKQIYHGVLRKGAIISVCADLDFDHVQGKGLILVGKTFFFVKVIGCRSEVEDDGLGYINVGFLVLDCNVQRICVGDEEVADDEEVF